jgi:hypothetical protein
MPYGYYQFIRIAGFVGFGALAYYENQRKNSILMILCIGAAILLNPVLKIHFSRTIWNNIDLSLAIGLAIWLFSDIIKIRKSKIL